MLNFGSYLHGKDVSIIGGAPSFDSNAFDADVVIRINEHAITQGGRADVIYSALANDPCQYFFPDILRGLRYFIGDRRGRHYSEALMHRFAVHGVGSDSFQTTFTRSETPNFEEFWLQRALAQYACKPFSAMIAALHVLSFPARRVFLTGCTFYAEDGFVPEWRHSHEIEPNRQIIRDLLSWDRRFRCDAACLESLSLPVKPETSGEEEFEDEQAAR